MLFQSSHLRSFIFSLIALSGISTQAHAIIGGEEVSRRDFVAEHTVAIGDGKKTFCTGTIVGENLILTAAHCVDGPEEFLYVGFGLNDFEMIWIPALKALAHPNYAPGPMGISGDDVAMILLADDILPGFSPVNIYSNNVIPTEGQTTLIAGYGVSDVVLHSGAGFLRQVELEVIGSESYLVALDATQGKGSCFGDSGGPAYLLEGGSYYFYGVLSFGTSAYCDEISVYSNISDFVEWGREMIGLLGQPTHAID